VLLDGDAAFAARSPDEAMFEESSVQGGMSDDPLAGLLDNEVQEATSFLYHTQNPATVPPTDWKIEVTPQQHKDRQLAKQVDQWDAETDASTELTPLTGGPGRHIRGEVPRGEVPVVHQGNRGNQEGMLRATQAAMTDSAAAMLKSDHMPSSAKGKEAVGAARSKEAAATEKNTKAGIMKPPEAVDTVACKTVAACQSAAQRHIAKSGSARSRGNELVTKGHKRIAIQWLDHAEAQKKAAISATVSARQLSIEDGKKSAAGAEERTLARARGKERTTKEKQASARDFHHKVQQERRTKQSTTKLQELHTVEEDAVAQSKAAKGAARVKQAVAVKAARLAQADRTIPSQTQAAAAAKDANTALNNAAHKAEDAVESKTKVDMLGAGIAMRKQLKAKDKACRKGEHMGKTFCSLSQKAKMLDCSSRVSQLTHPASHIDKCRKQADEDKRTCLGIVEQRREKCDKLAMEQTVGATIAGYVLRIMTSMPVNRYNAKADYHLRTGIAERLNADKRDVITLSVKAIGIETQIQIAVAGDEASLHAPMLHLLAALASGQPVGGIIATESKSQWRAKLTLPGSKPASWASERAQKSWKASQEENKKLAGMPTGSSAEEVNSKAHHAEMAAKRALAQSKTQEFKLKKQSMELTTKVETRKQLKAEEERVAKAEAESNSGLNHLVADSSTDGSKMDISENNRGGASASASAGDADFQVIRQRWWQYTQSWLSTHYPKLWQSLHAAKIAGTAQGSDTWMSFLLNWFYAKGREKLGYRYRWKPDGTYTPVRHIVISCHRYTNSNAHPLASPGTQTATTWEKGPISGSGVCGGKRGKNVYSVAVRSVNNLCYPGVNAADAKTHRPSGGDRAAEAVDSRSKACQATSAVSVRLSRFRLVKPKRTAASGLLSGLNGSPAMYLLRAYRSITPFHYTRPIGEFARQEDDGLLGVHRIKWTINMVAEYCETSMADGTATPYDETKSWPRKLYATGRMQWQPITVADQQVENSDVILTVMRLSTVDNKLGITCRATQKPNTVLAGQTDVLKPTDTKCDIKVSNWQYGMTCPVGKVRGLAVLTSLLTRYDGEGEDKRVGADSHKVSVAGGRQSMKFQKRASLRVLHPDGKWVNRGAVHMRMRVSEPHWIPSSEFQSHRHYQFSFGLDHDRMNQVQNSELLWDPELSSSFGGGEADQRDVSGDLERNDLSSPRGRPELRIANLLGLSPSTYDMVELQTTNEILSHHNEGLSHRGDTGMFGTGFIQTQMGAAGHVATMSTVALLAAAGAALALAR